MTLPDGLILFGLVVSAGLGLAHGFAREVLGLAGLAAGLILGTLFAPGFGGSVFGFLPAPLGLAAAFLVILLVVLFASALLGRLLTAALDAASLSVPNRVLGALFGLAKGAGFFLALFVALDLVGIDAGPWVAGSRLGEPAWQLARQIRGAVARHAVEDPASAPDPDRSTI
jgi:membrane protein required for colicin V production